LSTSNKELSRQIGLEVGSICGKYFLDLDHLHYGYWPGDLPVTVANVKKAQELYTRFVIDRIPAGVKTILDVGCGGGHVAKELLGRGYEVDCVSPCPHLAQKAAELLGDACHIYQCRYEDLQATSRYDLILFCESFQYLDMNQAMAKCEELLNPKGYVLICDYFRKDVNGKGGGSGGHKLAKFHGVMANHPFDLMCSMDITAETAPNMDLMDDIMRQVVKPVAEAGSRLIEDRHPWLYKVVAWKYRKKIDKLNTKYFSGERTGDSFRRTRAYLLLVYQMTPAGLGQGQGRVQSVGQSASTPESVSATT